MKGAIAAVVAVVVVVAGAIWLARPKDSGPDPKAWEQKASAAFKPTSTTIPAARSRAWPCPATSGLGSSIADTTRAIPAAITASAQGGDLP